VPNPLERARRALRRRRRAPAAAPALPDAAAVARRVRGRLADGRDGAAQGLAERLRAQPGGEPLGRLAGGIVAAHRGFHALAWAELEPLPPALWARHAPDEYAQSGLRVAPAAALAALESLARAGDPGVAPMGWYQLAGAAFGHGDQALAAALLARVGSEPGTRVAELHDVLAPWVAADPGSLTAPATGRRTLAIMDYGHPGLDRASANIGDHVQSIAALGHLVRHRGIRLHGEPELTALLERLGERVREERRRESVTADVDVIAVHRDASAYQAIPEDAWVLCFGWYMHALFTLRHGFPLHRNLRPIFVSFHCNKRELLTPEAIEYLRRYGPVGCRDWTTVYLLGSCGVPAFFSGCLTTTIDTVFPPAEPAPADAPAAFVDVPPDEVPEGGVSYAHSDPAVRRRSFARNADDAVGLLETYRREHPRVVTSRLHCYLPLRSLGVDVEFRPRNRADVRFDGLLDLSGADFAAIRDGLLEKLEAVHEAILGGAPEEDVYARWRAMTAGDVAAAEARRTAPAPLPRAPVPDLAPARRHGAAAGENAVDVAVVLRKGEGRALAVLADSLEQHSSRLLRLHVLARPGTEPVEARFAPRFPGLALEWQPTEGLPGRALRALLGELLQEVDRVVLLPLPAVATGDVTELAALDLGGHAFAAPLRPGASGFGVLHGAAGRLRDRTDAAAELRRTAHARHAFDFDAFSADVLVADLARWRADGIGAQALGLHAAYGLSDIAVLHLLAGPERATVPARWAIVPTRTPERGAGLVFWADPVKPWQRRRTPERALWRRQAEALRRRPAG
jgi:hypothetical protein